jgi:D-alanyl-lipoteichoic acid acyltransferase DltB (MBOAT superfamily)
LAYFLVGAVKKLVIADQLVSHVDVIFATPGRYDSATLLQGVIGYAIQLYCDFSGYSDMAIGCARILGYRFPQNFQMPFSATSITDFWRRWHITLSAWFRDYAFLPLEIATRGNPSPALRVSLNMLLMMLLVGLWHGPSWNFVIFGGIHGLALVFHRAWTTLHVVSWMQRGTALRILWGFTARLLTLAVVLLAFVFFRSESLTVAGTYLVGIASSWHVGTRMLSPYILGAFAVTLLVHLIVNKDRNLVEELAEMPATARVASYASLMMLLVSLGAGDASPFIYVQF